MSVLLGLEPRLTTVSLSGQSLVPSVNSDFGEAMILKWRRLNHLSTPRLIMRVFRVS